MNAHLSLIGFGEAGSSLAVAGAWGKAAHVFDRLSDDPVTRSRIVAAYREAGVSGEDDLAAALAGSRLVLSLVTADQALAAATAAARRLEHGAMFVDMNSVAPTTKAEAARAIEAAGGDYVDVAVMAPVRPSLLSVPLLLSGARAAAAAELLSGLGFSRVRIVGDKVGRASSIKMIRSVMVKGLEALSAEALLAAQAAGVVDEVVASLDAGSGNERWSERGRYNLERMAVHGVRRAEELLEVAKTLEGLGVGPLMTRSAEAWHRHIGGLRIDRPADDLPALLAQMSRKADAA